MALLTAEDVLNKAFSKTKYREGFDQDEVDDFLDEVANSISALTAERDELQARLSQFQAGGVPSAPVAQAPAAAAAAGLGSASAALLAAATDPNPPSATTMLSMAQRLHDDYVQAGEAERDRIIDEGKAKAETIVEQAEKDARGRMQSLDAERADLERRIDDLRRFERDYRGHLRNYLENLLGDLEHNAAKGTVDAPGADAKPFGAAAGVAADTFAAETIEDDAPEALAPETSKPEPSKPEPSKPEPWTAAPGNEEVAEQEPFAYAPVSPAPVAPSPFAASPFAPAPYASEPTQEPKPSPAPVSEPWATGPAAPQERASAFPEALPPFPGSPQAAAPYASPFADANPFAPTQAPSGGQPVVKDSSEGNPSGVPAPEDEAPRWNF